jgi:mevalonate kinase
VYGLPAIASALGSYTTARIKIVEGEGWTIHDLRPATLGYKKKKHYQAMKSISNIITFLKIDTKHYRLDITFGGNLVATSGIGASAAQCTALARALNKNFKLGLNDSEINEAAYEGEKAYHGTPSGIDNTASTYGGLIWFVRNLYDEENTLDFIKSSKKMFLVIANSGITSSTKEVVEDVLKFKKNNPEKFEKVCCEYKKIAYEARKSLPEGDIIKIGLLMNKNQKLLQEIGVSGEINNQIVEIAYENGASGAKMTGTGRGGLVICLAENEAKQGYIAEAIKEEGFDVFKTTIGKS